MGAAAALSYTYEYPFASSVGQFDHGFGLRLATCGANHEHPHFFEGLLRHPRVVGDMLIALSDIVQTHYFMPNQGILRDPVVTSNEEMLRFEGFSGCCGAYARVDLDAKAFDSELQGRGTTNVDFNTPMRAALIRLRDRSDARLSVGQDEVVLAQGDNSAIEKKVKLPIRWIKSFSEVQAYQPSMNLKLEVSATEARRFIRSLPRGNAPKRPCFISQMGKSMRLSQRDKPGSVRVQGVNRLLALEPLMGAAQSMRVWHDNDAHTSGWEIEMEGGRFFLMISPELYRGFSGEGQMLEKLATGKWDNALASVQGQLAWQSQIDATSLAEKTGFDSSQIEAALAVLGSRGLAGYDLTKGKYFHRILPFELDKVEKLQPRLKGARKLLKDKKVEILTTLGNDEFDLSAGGTGVTHHVRLRADGDKCTCPWHSKHQGQRGPCKHILASRMLTENQGVDS
ncbi:MAG: SWIM zinc finger family protein [Phycisphaerales bacterium]|jgi:hypothetical protein|nr:SWIM zinc finger family protein [Phycisphaerales bacterium]